MKKKQFRTMSEILRYCILNAKTLRPLLYCCKSVCAMNNKDTSEIVHSVENGICKIVLNRPKKRNAINRLMYEKLLEILHESIDDSSTFAVVLTGAGTFFSSGNDFSPSSILNQDENNFSMRSAVTVFKNFIDALIRFPKLLIAVVNGPAVGIAVTMLPLFDIVFASDMASFHTPFTSLGLVGEGCSTYTFPKILGHSKAGEMLYLGHKMDASEAKQFGLVSQVYKHECLNDVWINLKRISTLSLESIMTTKSLAKKWDKNILQDVNEQESVALVQRLESPDCMERLMNVMLRKSKI